MPLILLLPLLLLLNTPVRAQGDPDAGRELARRWCTACHVVDREGTGTDAAPALPSLLAGKRRSAEEIEGWLADPHPPMPNLDLSRQEIDNILAYLQSFTGQ
jgi:mono/diheme cytochrome c family protein